MTFNITVLLVVLAALASTTEARLQGYNNHRTGSTNTYSSDKNIQQQQQQRQRELNEEENDKILAAMEKEYREDEASKQKAYEKGNASHNKIVPVDKESAKKEEYHQAQVHAEKKEKDQAKATVVDGLESIVKMEYYSPCKVRKQKILLCVCVFVRKKIPKRKNTSNIIKSSLNTTKEKKLQ